MKSADASIPLRDKDIRPFRERASEYLTLVQWAPKPTAHHEARPGFRDSSLLIERPTKPMSVLEIGKKLSNEPFLFTEEMFHLLRALREGVAIGMHVSDLYQKHSGLKDLIDQNSRGVLSEGQKTEFQAKTSTAAAVGIFVTAYYVLWNLSSYRPDEVDRVKVPFDGVPELPLQGAVATYRSQLYYLGEYMTRVETGLQAIKMTLEYFKKVIDDLQLMPLQYSEPFTSVAYRLEETKFVVRGFETELTHGGPVVEFKRVEATEVVGNHEAKRLTARLSQFVMAYDFEKQLNPMTEFGAFPWIFLFQGQPGTGKSMLLSVMQTQVKDYCTALGVPFVLTPIPNSMVSSLQGESAVQYERWWQHLMNPKAIIVAPVDDAEAVYLDRREQSSSEGSKMIVMSHLRLTEGSTALTRGNVLQPHATNNADMIDPAVFSRYQARVSVPGAQTANDVMDQMRMWGDGLNKKAGNRTLIDLSWPQDYAHLSDQGRVSKEEQEATKREALVRFKNVEVAKIWDEVNKGKPLKVNSYDLYGQFFVALRKRFPQFTSRDIRNITVSATSRLFGFDFPPEWLATRQAFIEKDYDTKKKMILDAALQYQKGLTVDQVLFQVMVQYTDTTIEMLDSGRRHRIQKRAEDMLEHQEALALTHPNKARSQDAA
jgi:hypothetical protein